MYEIKYYDILAFLWNYIRTPHKGLSTNVLSKGNESLLSLKKKVNEHVFEIFLMKGMGLSLLSGTFITTGISRGIGLTRS